jgi:hypothetical protein
MPIRALTAGWSLVLALGCSRALPTSGPEDLSTAPDLGRLACDRSRTRTIPGGGPIELGSFCDEVSFCVADQAAAQAVMNALPVFTCGISARCAPTQYRCEWSGQPPHTIDADELAQICAATAIASEIVCVVFV